MFMPITILTHLVLPRREVVSVKFLCRKNASHMSIHVELLLLLYDVSCAGCYYSDRPVLREHGLGHNTYGVVKI